MEFVSIFSLRLAGYLMLKGFVLMSVDENKTLNNGRKIFFFRKSPQIQEAMSEFQRNRSNIIQTVA